MLQHPPMKPFVIILAFLLAGFLLSCEQSRPEPRLQGTWRSNKEETVAAWRRDGLIASRVIDQFEKDVLGKMTVTFAGRRVTSTSGDWTEIGDYQLVESGTDYVIYNLFSKVHGRDLRMMVRFVKGGYWISNDEILKGYTEKFDRVN